MDRVQKIKAIPTKYKGVIFRSRLEARWAVYFDYFRIEWAYEFQGFELSSGCYLPDFWLPQVNLWAEVKPVKLTKLEELKVEDLVVGTEKSCLLLVGQPKCCPVPCIEPAIGKQTEDEIRAIAKEMGLTEKRIDELISLERNTLPKFNDDCYEVGNYFASGKTMIWDVVLSNEKLDENRFFHSTGLKFSDKLDSCFDDVEHAVSAALSAKF